MNIKPNAEKFLTSLNSELEVQSSRVRDLIGDKHWLSDGEHKEAIISGLVARYLPNRFSVGNGFVVSPENLDAISRQIDVLVFDPENEPPLFMQGEFLVCFATNTVAAISVKSRLTKKTFRDSLKNLLSVSCLVDISSQNKPALAGIFFDDTKSTPQELAILVRSWVNDEPDLREALAEMARYRVAFATTQGLLMRVRLESGKSPESGTLAIYACDGVSASALICSVSAHACGLLSPTPSNFSIFAANNVSSELLDCVPLEPPTDA